jgi:hypothetical protein
VPPIAPRNKHKPHTPDHRRSVRVARQMRDAYGLKPKDRPAMYVKCKVPEFERNVAQVRGAAQKRAVSAGFSCVSVRICGKL